MKWASCEDLPWQSSAEWCCSLQRPAWTDCPRWRERGLKTTRLLSVCLLRFYYRSENISNQTQRTNKGDTRRIILIPSNCLLHNLLQLLYIYELTRRKMVTHLPWLQPANDMYLMTHQDLKSLWILRSLLTCDVQVDNLAELLLCADLTLVQTLVRCLRPPTHHYIIAGLSETIRLFQLMLNLDNIF